MAALEARSPAPRRIGPVPWLVVLAVALVPAIGLLALHRWADGRAPDPDALAEIPAPLVDPPLPPDPLANVALSFRRVPEVLSRDLNVERFRGEVAAFLDEVGDRSCASVAVDGTVVGARNADLAVIPASTQKLVVAAVALDVLGADHVFRTSVLASAAPVDGTVAGDLVLLGGGDPVLTSSWYPTSGIERRPVQDGTSLDELADRVRDAGVTRIEGSVLGDGSRHDDERYAPGWGTGVAGLEAGPYGGLMANDSRVLGEDVKADDPAAGAAREFARLLGERGIEVVGGASAGSATSLGASPVELAAIDSAPLDDVVAEMLTTSDNNTAEVLVKEIGAAEAAAGGADGAPVGATRQAGLDVMLERLGRWGVDTAPVVLADGSGLSPDDRLTCDALLTVLERDDVDGPIGSGLAVAGETGTLADVFASSDVAGRLRGKTGTLNNPPFNQDPPAVKALAGYLPVDGGGAVEYALVLNGPTISDQSEYRPVWNAFADTIDTYPSGASPADVGLR